jgi:predicted transcriptional regulator YdeE
MDFIELEAFHIIGIEARTSFQKEHNGANTFLKQWDRVRRGEVIQAIPHRVDQDIISLYTDYESDLYGEYTFVIGARVSSTDQVPEGMVAKHIPAARYKLFTSERGDVSHITIDTWKRIWNDPCPRTYRNDFEVYGAKSIDPMNSVVDIYIGCR